MKISSDRSLFSFSLSMVYIIHILKAKREQKTRGKVQIHTTRRLINLISDRIRDATESVFFPVFSCHLFNRIKLFILVSLYFNYKVVFFM